MPELATQTLGVLTFLLHDFHIIMALKVLENRAAPSFGHDVWKSRGVLGSCWLDVVYWVEHLVLHPFLVKKSLASEAVLVQHVGVVLALFVLVAAVGVIYLYIDLHFSPVFSHFNFLALNRRLPAHFANEGSLKRSPEYVPSINRALLVPFLNLVLQVLQVDLQLGFLAYVLLNLDLACLDVIVVYGGDVLLLRYLDNIGSPFHLIF